MKEISANIHDAKTNLSKYLAMMESGEIERVILKRRNQEIGEINLRQPKNQRRFGFFGEVDLGYDKQAADKAMEEIWDEYFENLDKQWPPLKDE